MEASNPAPFTWKSEKRKVIGKAEELGVFLEGLPFEGSPLYSPLQEVGVPGPGEFLLLTG